MKVSDHAANDWTPRLAVDAGGRAHIVWDSYREGSYNVYMKTYQEGAVGPLVVVADTNRFEAHPSVAAGQGGRVWVAWDEGAANWGKDNGLTVNEDWDEDVLETWDVYIDKPFQTRSTTLRSTARSTWWFLRPAKGRLRSQNCSGLWRKPQSVTMTIRSW